LHAHEFSGCLGAAGGGNFGSQWPSDSRFFVSAFFHLMEIYHMKSVLSLLALGAALSFNVAHAADGEAKTKQQSKMATCNAEAGDQKGDERKAFMKTCLSAKKETQQSKMKTCNVDAKGKKGDERKAFMKECLSAK
jgi:hypothetical protein